MKIPSLLRRLSGATVGNQPRPLDRRLCTALVMIAVAALGATTAYRAALAEHESALSAQVLTQASFIGLTLRKGLQGQKMVGANIESQRVVHAERARNYLRTAEQLWRQNSKDIADMLRLEGLAEARSDESLRWIEKMILQLDSQTAETDEVIAGMLAELGFEDLRPGESSQEKHSSKSSASSKQASEEEHDLFQPLEERLEHQHEAVVRLTLATVIFVLALVLFTVSDLARASRAYRPIWWAGMATALVAATLALLIDVELRIWLAWEVAAMAIVFYAGWRTGVLGEPAVTHEALEPGELESEGFLGTRIPGAHAHDAFSQRIILAIALTVLLSACVGYSYSRSSVEAERVGHEAVHAQFQLAEQAGGGLMQVATFVIDEVHWEERDAGRDRFEWLTRNFPTQWEEGTGRTFDSDEDVDHDQLLTQLQSSFSLLGVWDVLSAQERAAFGRMATLLAVLTIFSIAVYLFGQALAMRGGRAAFYLSGFGGLCVLVGMLLAAGQWLSAESPRASAAFRNACQQFNIPVPTRADPARLQIAAQHLARAQIGTLTDAMINSEPGTFGSAAQHLRCATEMQPDMAPALDLLADRLEYDVIRGSGRPRPSAEAARAWYDAAHAGMRLKIGRGYDRPVARLVSLSMASLASALLSADVTRAREALALAKDAVQKVGTAKTSELHARAHMALGAAYLATGAISASGEAYGHALRKESPPTDYEAAYAQKMLRLIADQCGQLDDAKTCARVRAEATRIASLLDARTGGVSVQGLLALEGRGSSSAMGVRGNLPMTVRPENLRLDWYQLDESYGVWEPVDAVSGTVLPRELQGSAIEAWRSSLSVDRASEAGARVPRYCLYGGSYRAIVRSGDKPIAFARVTLNASPSRPDWLRDSAVQLCRPIEWREHEWSYKDAHGEHYLQGYARPGAAAKPAAVILRASVPQSILASAATADWSAYTRSVMVDLEAAGLATGREALIERSRGTPCPAQWPAQALVVQTWVNRIGIQKFVIAFADAAPPQALCEMLDSADEVFPDLTL